MLSELVATDGATGSLWLIPETPEVLPILARALVDWSQSDPDLKFSTCCGGSAFVVPIRFFAEYGDLAFTSRGEEVVWWRDLESTAQRVIVTAEDFVGGGGE